MPWLGVTIVLILILVAIIWIPMDGYREGLKARCIDSRAAEHSLMVPVVIVGSALAVWAVGRENWSYVVAVLWAAPVVATYYFIPYLIGVVVGRRRADRASRI
jgi:polyferredoxin